MKESSGGIPALTLVFAFIIIISGYLAFSINYSKAFKMKSRIVDVIQASENFTDKKVTDAEIAANIKNYADSIGYSASTEFTKTCDSSLGWKTDLGEGWCYKVITKQNKNESVTTTYVAVKTFVSIDIPIFNKLFPNIRYFQVDGSTKATIKVN